MNQYLDDLDREWETVAAAPASRRRYIQWTATHPEFAGLATLDELLAARRDPKLAPALLTVLAALAPTDELAARALLQAVVPGMVCLIARSAKDDPNAAEEMVSLAWERIRTYPPTRGGSVAGNILLDVLKRYRHHRSIEQPTGGTPITSDLEGQDRTEDTVMNRLLLEEVITAHSAGIVTAPALTLVLRTRLLGEPLEDVSAEMEVPQRNLCQRRWRAECRLRELLDAA
jgi:hypothetical protein